MKTVAQPAFKRRVLGVGIHVALILMNAGCVPLRPFSHADEARKGIKQPDVTVPQGAMPEVMLPIESSLQDTFWVRPALSHGTLPNLRVQGLSVTESGLFDVLQLILADSNMPLSFEGGSDAAARYGVVTLNNLSGPFDQVMDKLGEIMGFFWSVTDSGVLRIMPEQQFVVTMPPSLAEDSMAGITNTLLYLGAQDTYLDRVNRSLVFRADRRALKSVESYMDRMRQTRSLIVYDVNVLQVDLNDNSNMGVSWESFTSGHGLNAGLDASVKGASSTATTLSQVARTSTGLESLVFGRNFSTDILVKFLKTQGDVHTLSQPKIGLMNGTNGMIRVGQSLTFVSKVGSQIVNGVSQSTADTQALRTGLEISLTGEVSESTVYTRIGISITELLSLTQFTALGINLNLPEVADRELRTQVRCRPGDTILLGGITVTRSQDDFSSGALIQSKTKDTKQTELVVTIRPRLLTFGQVAKADVKPGTELGLPVPPLAPTRLIEPAVDLDTPDHKTQPSNHNQSSHGDQSSNNDQSRNHNQSSSSVKESQIVPSKRDVTTPPSVQPAKQEKPIQQEERGDVALQDGGAVVDESTRDVRSIQEVADGGTALKLDRTLMSLQMPVTVARERVRRLDEPSLETDSGVMLGMFKAGGK